MSFNVLARGSLILRVRDSDEQIEIASSELRQGEPEHVKSDLKGSDEQVIFSFHVNTKWGRINWAVETSIGLSDSNIESIECVSIPSGLNIIEDFSFEIEEGTE